jgi:predicted RNase H-like nuclease
MNVIGIDGCRRGWFFVQLLDAGQYNPGLVESLHELCDRLLAAELALIDIPLGLKSAGREERSCDREARKLLGARGSSVFPVPCRQALQQADYPAASAVNHEVTGRKLSRQSWAIAPKIAEADRLIRSLSDRRKLREAHPELCFRALNHGQPMPHNKKTRPGKEARLALLERHLPRTREIVEEARTRWRRKDLATDDILDALVCAVAATQPKSLISLPALTERDDFGLIMEIVFPGRLE